MPLNKPKRIEDYILIHLENGPVLMLDLVKKIDKDRSGTTKQAVYAALRVLKQNEQIIAYKGLASLNLTWINQMTSFFDFAKNNYVKGENKGSFIDLEDREKIKYYFKNPIKADIFWTHALFLLAERSAPHEPVFVYNPHEWFMLARQENEENIFKTINRGGRKILLTAGGNLFLDRYIRKYFDNEMSQYYAKEKPLFKENNYYLNIIGDFMIEAWLDKKVADQVEKIYHKTAVWDENVLAEMQKILNDESRIKLVISRNHKKAEKIKNSLKKYFVLK